MTKGTNPMKIWVETIPGRGKGPKVGDRLGMSEEQKE